MCVPAAELARQYFQHLSGSIRAGNAVSPLRQRDGYPPRPDARLEEFFIHRRRVSLHDKVQRGVEAALVKDARLIIYRSYGVERHGFHEGIILCLAVKSELIYEEIL